MSRAQVKRLDALGRQRLSRHFYMRQFLYSEIGNGFGIPNLPEDDDLALEAGRNLARTLLDPLVETFGHVEVRSAYRGREVNSFGNEQKFNCGSNEFNRAHHIWDWRDKDGHLGATACVFIPWFTEQFERGRDWRDLAYWLHDHLAYSEIVFFRAQCSFNLNWNEQPAGIIKSWITERGGCPALIKRGAEPEEDAATRQTRYADFPEFCALTFPESPR